jgi:hypothetical protein
MKLEEIERKEIRLLQRNKRKIRKINCKKCKN